MDQKLYEELTRDEGKRLRPYRDTNNLWTIGVGHLLGPGPAPRMIEITEEECQALFFYDVETARQALMRVFWGPGTPSTRIPFFFLTPARQRALINMAFNRGQGNMAKSTTITPAIKQALDQLSVNEQEAWDKVSEAILGSPWAAQIGPRAERLAKMLRTGGDA